MSNAMPARLDAAAAVSAPRLWQLLMDLARHGATAKGGVNRQALSDADVAARRHMISWGRERGYGVVIDEIGNIFLRREGRDNDLAPVLTGSHLDTQPTGGKFDGAYGVAAGMEMLAAFDDAGMSTRRPIEVASWTNEEGCRFFPGCIGSGVHTGVYPLGKMLTVADRDGIVLGDVLAAALQDLGMVSSKTPPRKPHCYVEAHIEQGPLLEMAGREVGIVTGFQGGCRMKVEVVGEEAHAGTTPRVARRDALFSAVSIVEALKLLTADNEDALRFTIGRADSTRQRII